LELYQIKGITFKKSDKIRINPPAELIDNIDILPFLDLSLYETKFRNAIVPRVYSARGCQNRCLYCTADNSLNRKYRKKNVKLGSVDNS